MSRYTVPYAMCIVIVLAAAFVLMVAVKELGQATCRLLLHLIHLIY